MIYLFKGKNIKKNRSLINRINGAEWLYIPINFNEYLVFTITLKLERKLKLMNLNDVQHGGRQIKQLKRLVEKCKKFKSKHSFIEYSNTIIEKKQKKIKSYEYLKMPKNTKKDNKKNHGKNIPKLDKMSKNELIKMGNKICTINIRRPRKNASRKTWKNFIENFYNEKFHDRH